MPERPLPNLPNLPPEVIREFPDRGNLWLLEDPVQLRDLIRLLEPELAERLDVDRASRINRSFIPEDLRKRESDLLFAIPFLDGSGEVTVYLLLEHQSGPDPEMPLRLLSYMLLIWERQQREWRDKRVPRRQRRLRPVIPLVFYTGRRGWKTPLRLADLIEGPEELHRFVPAWETLFLNLHRTPPETLTRFGSALGHVLRVVQAEHFSREEFAARLKEALAGLGALPEEQTGQWVRATWYLALAAMHRRPEEEYTDLEGWIRDSARESHFWVPEEVIAMPMTAIQAAEARGRAEAMTAIQAAEARGRAEAMTAIQAAEARAEALGRAEGELTGLRRALGEVLSARFGSVPAWVAAAIDKADAEVLRQWLRQATAVPRLEDVGFQSVQS